MIFVNEPDYGSTIKDDILDRILQGDSSYLWDAEKRTKSEIEGYLSSRFDTNAIFSQTGDNRHQYLVEIFIDIALYKVHKRINPRQIPDLRVDNYERAIAWLKMVTKGEVTPDLPLLPSEGEGQQTNAIGFGSKQKRCNEF